MFANDKIYNTVQQRSPTFLASRTGLQGVADKYNKWNYTTGIKNSIFNKVLYVAHIQLIFVWIKTSKEVVKIWLSARLTDVM